MAEQGNHDQESLLLNAKSRSTNDRATEIVEKSNQDQRITIDANRDTREQ